MNDDETQDPEALPLENPYEDDLPQDDGSEPWNDEPDPEVGKPPA